MSLIRNLKLSAFQLKLIALFSMLLDHAAKITGNEILTFMLPLGRIAWPVFAYFTAEAMRFTRNRFKYLMRLAIFAIISEIPFDFAFNDGRVNFLQNTNIFYTLFLGALAIMSVEWLANKISMEDFKVLSYLMIAPFFLIANILNTDYAGFGVFFIVMLYFIKKYNLRLLAMLLGSIILFSPWDNIILYHEFNMIWFSVGLLIASLLIYFYNGEKGKHSLKWLFYTFYPLHLILLILTTFI